MLRISDVVVNPLELLIKSNNLEFEVKINVDCLFTFPTRETFIILTSPKPIYISTFLKFSFNLD